MEELKTWDNLTDDQKNQIKTALSKSKTNLLIKTAILIGTLFLCNTVTLTIGRMIAKDPDPISWEFFCFFTSLVNSIFCIRHYVKQTNQINDKLKEQIKNIIG